MERAIGILKKDERLVGVAVAGSLAENRADEFSDIDLVIAVEPDAFTSVMDERRCIAASLGRLIAAFTGEHVSGVRHVESKAPGLAEALAGTLALHDARSLWEALNATIALYRSLREKYGRPFEQNAEAEKVVVRYVRQCMAAEPR